MIFWKPPRPTLIIGLTMFTIAPTFADEAVNPSQVPNPPSMGSISRSDHVDTITVTATRSPIKAFYFPGMVSVLGREDFGATQPSTPDDILQHVPGVEFTGGPRRTGEIPSIRGFSGPDVIILIDGTRQNFGSGHDGRFFVDPSLLREVEVLRGPASTVYGSGGNGGVIEFRTMRAADYLDDVPGLGFSTSFGHHTANQEWIATGTGFALFDDGTDLIASITKRNAGTIKLGNGSKLYDNDDDILAGMAKAGFQLAPHHHLETAYVRFDNTAKEPNNGQGTGEHGLVEKNIVADTVRATWRYDNPQDTLFNSDLVVYYTSFAADELRLDGNGTGPQGEVVKRDVETIGTRFDNRTQLLTSTDSDLTLVYGFEYYRDKQDGVSASGDRDGVPDAKASFKGVFLQADWQIERPLGLPGEAIIIPGMRYDAYNASSSIAASIDRTAISPRLSVSYLPAPWLQGFVSLARAFRAPTFDELYLSGVHFQIPIGPGVTNRFVPNPDLKPQETETIEFGGGVDFEGVLLETGDRLQLKASHFVIKGNDFIDLEVTQPTPFADCNPFVPGACDGTATTVNVPRARLSGTEVMASYQAGALRLALGYSSIDGENKDTGAKLGTLAPDQYTAGLSYQIPGLDAFVGWDVIAAAAFDKTDDPAEIRGGYAVHDASLSWQSAVGALAGLRLDLGIDNVFDKSYARTYTDATETGRNYKMLMSYTRKW